MGLDKCITTGIYHYDGIRQYFHCHENPPCSLEGAIFGSSNFFSLIPHLPYWLTNLKCCTVRFKVVQMFYCSYSLTPSNHAYQNPIANKFSWAAWRLLMVIIF